jgi:hypothetical protein
MSTPVAGNTPQPAVVSGVKLTVSQICRSIPGSRGKPSLSPSTVTRWILRGCPSLSGERVKLKASRVGSRWMVDPADLEAFFDALGSSRSGEDAPKPGADVRSSRERRLASTRAAKELERRGA